MGEDSLAPTLLLAMPQMEDPNFARSVVLLCRHEKDGAMGLVVNRKTDTRATSVAVIEPPPVRDNGLEVWIGGPVEPHRGWLLLGFDPGTPGSLDVGQGLYLSASADTLRQVIETESESGPSAEHRFLLGYAGWGGGQLEAELAASAWLTADVSKPLIFETPAESMWEAAIRSLGINPYSLQMGSGVH
ncbi:MAG: YqgE/AlgH family protein [Candidatus Binatia bacterium]